SAQKVLPKKRYEAEGWDYLEEGTLKLSRSACVCVTCFNFRCSCDKHCHTSLSCCSHHCLVLQGANLTSKCPLWHKNYEDKFGFCPEAA
ncbi:galactose oxidase, partial [Prochlorococcus sp. MIT 0602]|uniref:galactose oxidase n=2 Tax=Prochlorococcus TaxID=1218 RepID=UPI0009DE21CC